MTTLSKSARRYFPVIALAVDIHPVAHSISTGERYSARTHIERLRECRRWILDNPDQLPANITDPVSFLRIVNDLKFAHDPETSRIFIGTRELTSTLNASPTRHGALAGTIHPEKQTHTYLQAICYVIQNGLTSLPFLIVNPTPECVGILTNLQGTFPDVDILPHSDSNLLLV